MESQEEESVQDQSRTREEEKNFDPQKKNISENLLLFSFFSVLFFSVLFFCCESKHC